MNVPAVLESYTLPVLGWFLTRRYAMMLRFFYRLFKRRAEYQIPLFSIFLSLCIFYLSPAGDLLMGM